MQKVYVFNNQEAASKWLAMTFSALIAKNNRLNKKTTLGFATGVTPLLMYRYLIMLNKGTLALEKRFVDDKNIELQKPISWKNVTTFNLDEFVGVNEKHPELFFNYMKQHLFNDLDLKPENIHFPNGNAIDIEKAAQAYEAAISENGNIDLQLISLGINGHMAYNEPGTPLDSLTHVATLSAETRKNLVTQGKFKDLQETPTLALTVGVGTILEKMNHVIMVAFGTSKAQMVSLMLEGTVNSEVTASALQNHKNCLFVLDKEAASKLKGTNLQIIPMN